MKDWNIRKLAEAGLMLALAFVLSNIKIYRAPNGGSVTAGSMIPIILFSLRHGVGPGMIIGAGFGLLKLIFGGYVFSPLQAFIEYPLAFSLLGLSGIFSESLEDVKNLNYLKIIFPIMLAIGLRFICHLVAGVIFFGSTLPENVSPWISSALYQVSYLVPEFIISAFIMVLIWKPVMRLEQQFR